MRCAVVTALGPGHEHVVSECKESVRIAMQRPGRFAGITHVIVNDTDGVLGCPGAKNRGIDMTETDWYIFIDADDLIEPDAFELNNFEDVATFGAVKLTGWKTWKNVYPCGFREIAINGAGGTLTMGFFVRSDVMKALRFNESDDVSDDFDFYLRLPSFTKRERPIVTTRTDVASASGPRRIGHVAKDWTGRCNEMIRKAVTANPGKFNVAPELVLSNVAPYL